MNSPSRPLPTWLLGVASACIGIYLLVFLLLSLSARNGPWPVMGGSDFAPGPRFATGATEITAPYILRPLYLSHNYRFISNHVDEPALEFEVKLTDKTGKSRTLRFPDKHASFWVRHRQGLLAQHLGTDQPIRNAQGQDVRPKGQEFTTFSVWIPDAENDPNSPLHLERLTELGLKPGRGYMGPRRFSEILAESIGRYLCREHNAVSAEVVRVHRNSIPPELLLVPANVPYHPQMQIFQDLTCKFGEVKP